MIKIAQNITQEALSILNSGIQAAHPSKAILEAVKINSTNLYIKSPQGRSIHLDLNKYRRIFVIGAGKAVSSMAKTIEEIFETRIHKGHVIAKYGHTETLNKISCTEAGHPIPDENGVGGTGKILEILEELKENDLVICLISGGGSALLVRPFDHITLQELKECSNVLINCGATINEINTIRKHISRVKGGQLAKETYPATLVTLIISDVIGDPLDVIASGPCVPDLTTFKDAKNIIDKYNLAKDIPKSVLDTIESGIKKQIPETPKKGETIFNNVNNFILCNNSNSLLACRKHAESLDFNTVILTSYLYGDVKEIAKFFVSLKNEIINFNNPVKKPACILSGGEPTVIVKGNGLGGRNQELALAFLAEDKYMDNSIFLSCGTDGTDGPTDAAGAYVNKETIEYIKNNNIDFQTYLNNNDSYHFFEKSGGHIKTGPTNTNVMDIQMLIVKN
jgi:hydroxypyruvate reductase